MTSTPTHASSGLPSEAISHLHEGRVIEAIKIVREARGVQLKEAKDMVDAYIQSQPSLRQTMAARRTEARRTLRRWLVVIGFLGALAYLAEKAL